MRRLVVALTAAAAIAASGIAVVDSVGGRPPSAAAAGAPLLAVVREGSVWCVDDGPAGSQPPRVITGPPTASCPAPCPSGPTAGATAPKPRAKSRPTPSCPKPFRSAIYLVGADGNDPRRFATGVEPAWSPDGNELAYVSGRFLTIQGIGGSPSADTVVALPTALAGTGAISGPTWSPDGRQIVFSVAQTSPTITGGEWREELYAIDLPSGDLRQVTATVSGASDHSASFSPDGGEIAYAHWGEQAGIWLTRPDGSDAHPVALLDGWAAGVSWSPDGQRILFSLLAEPFFPRGKPKVDRVQSGIYVVNADGSGLHLVVPHDELYILDTPAWSPDGQEIEFTAADPSTSRRALYEVETDGSGLEPVLREPWSVWQPAWQPRPAG